jgi:hypothetical protein
VPLPIPGLPDVMASQAALLVADQTQCDDEVTANVPLALSLLNEAWLGEISIVQGPAPSS